MTKIPEGVRLVLGVALVFLSGLFLLPVVGVLLVKWVAFLGAHFLTETAR